MKVSLAEAARKGAALPTASKEMQVRLEGLAAPPSPPPRMKTCSQDPVRGVKVSQSKSRSRDTCIPSSRNPKPQRVVRAFSKTQGPWVHTALQTFREVNAPLSELVEEDMDSTLSALQSTVLSTRAEATPHDP